jgi:hypothetical protein
MPRDALETTFSGGRATLRDARFAALPRSQNTSNAGKDKADSGLRNILIVQHKDAETQKIEPLIDADVP